MVILRPFGLRVAPWVPARARGLRPSEKTSTEARAWPGHKIYRVPALSCPGRVERALLRERNETRDPGATRRALTTRSLRLGVSRLDRAGKAPLVGGAVAEGGGDRLHGLIGAAAGLFLGGGAVAELRQVGAVAGDEGDAVAGRTVTGDDDGGLERLQPVEAREPLPKARMRARKGRLSAHGEIA